MNSVVRGFHTSSWSFMMALSTWTTQYGKKLPGRFSVGGTVARSDMPLPTYIDDLPKIEKAPVPIPFGAQILTRQSTGVGDASHTSTSARPSSQSDFGWRPSG